MSLTGMLLTSLLLIAAAAVTLVFGWVNASEALVVASIAFSAASAVFMAMGLYRSRPRGRARRAPKGKKARAARSDR
ncbi:MAG: hypothetical protein M3271_09030 [Actinomycetota bacterium]|nr:hypothetical protein [Actinomycetota bacterium]